MYIQCFPLNNMKFTAAQLIVVTWDFFEIGAHLLILYMCVFVIVYLCAPP